MSDEDSGKRVQVWSTNPDKQLWLKKQDDLSLSANGGQIEDAASLIEVDDRQTFQTIDGFGASLTDSSAYLLARVLPDGPRDALMRALFDPMTGIGLSFLRQPMGASDFSTVGNYSYDDIPAGETDYELKHFSIQHDYAYIVPLLQQARQLNPALKIMASPWSAPGWMKTTGNMIGGQLKPTAYQAFAQYFVRFIQAYEAEGLPIYALTLQNEPQFTPPGYPGMLMNAEEQAEIIKQHLGPALKRAGLEAKILAYDHNWQDEFSKAAADFPQKVLADSAAYPFVAGAAYHWYGGSSAVQSEFQAAFPDKEVYITEASGGGWQIDPFSEQVNLLIGGLTNYARAVVNWNLALDTQHGPTNGGCMNCRGVVTVNQADQSFSFNLEYYTLGHFSKFLRPGAVRVASATATSENIIQQIAFRNSNGQRVLVAYNRSAALVPTTVQDGQAGFSCKLAANELATFIWQ